MGNTQRLPKYSTEQKCMEAGHKWMKCSPRDPCMTKEKRMGMAATLALGAMGGVGTGYLVFEANNSIAACGYLGAGLGLAAGTQLPNKRRYGYCYKTTGGI
eukprot:TRINITY_DN70509_c0_g1_i1.p3 TRINITY_DN70509_c0_g1~~TRINITY_DN70509_c0_g1_i1.p3  ORF type:complete len:101 (+),score=23.02 TRINITY_DN70509_c0_g1_i1:99-401(+)